jgi:hypothetical protein
MLTSNSSGAPRRQHYLDRVRTWTAPRRTASAAGDVLVAGTRESTIVEETKALTRLRLYAVFSRCERDPATGAVLASCNRVLGPYRIIEITPDRVGACANPRQPVRLANATAEGKWALLDGLTDDAPAWDSVCVVSPPAGVDAATLTQRF